MNIELFSYSLFATVLGMLVVFLSLSALSAMMVVLKRIFVSEVRNSRGGRSGGGRADLAAGRKDRAGKLEQTAPGLRIPDWVPVAVAVYLAEEDEPDRPSADPWNAVVNHYDPWVSPGRSGQQGA
jgi:Na+-transporting methylmalonyl-CoA/oxaloacetate decarboxylase gamma subunit